MTDENIEAALESLGLTQYQAAAYSAVLRLGSSSAVDIAEEGDIPQSRVYDVLRELESNGYVETYEQDSLHARALDPDDVKANLREHAETLSDAADSIDTIWQKSGFDDHQITLVQRRETVFEEARDAIREADTEIQIAATPAQFDRLRPSLVEARNRDVFVRLTIFPPEEGETVDLSSVSLEGAVTEAKEQQLPAQFVLLVDRSTTCFAPNGAALREEFGIIANSVPLAYVFHWFFLTALWEVWPVVYSERGDEPPIPYIDIRQCVRDIVVLLDEGATITVSVDGEDVATGESRQLSGTVADVTYEGEGRVDGYPSLSDVAGQTTIIVDTGDEEVSVGGWVPTVEDIEMHRLTIEGIEY